MTDTIEQKALALLNEVQKVRGHTGSPWNSPAILNEALYRAIEQHEALEAENERLRVRLAHAEDDCEDDCIYCEERRQEIARAALGEKQ